MDRLMVTRRRKHSAHARGLPWLEGGAELVGELARTAGKACTLVGARDAELAGAHQNVGATELADGVVHDRHAAPGLGIELTCMIEPQPVDQHARALGKARTDEAAVAARRAPADPTALQQRHALSLLRQKPSRMQAREAAAHDRDIGLFPVGERRALLVRVSRGGIPACRIVDFSHFHSSPREEVPWEGLRGHLL